jgi:O-antigen polymerase
LKEYENAYLKLQENGVFMQMYGKSLVLSKNFTKAKIVLQKASEITSDYILYITLGDLYLETKQFNISEAYYKKAAYMEPSKLYPHYLLAKMYELSGNHFKAVKKAKEVITRNVKIKDIVEKDLKNKMNKLIQQSK